MSFWSFSSEQVRKTNTNSFSREYCGDLPLVLVFGIATTVTLIHQRLPSHICSKLAIEKFSGQKATELLGKLVESLYKDEQVNFRLGGRTLDRLLEMFIMNDFSAKRFLSGYKVRIFVLGRFPSSQFEFENSF